MHKFLTNFNSILFSLIFFIVQPNMRKSFSFTFFSFLNTFQEANITSRKMKDNKNYLKIHKISNFLPSIQLSK